MKTLKARLKKLERHRPKPGVISLDDMMRYWNEHQGKEIEELDADDPRLATLVPGWELELIREQKRAEAAGTLAPAIQLDFG